MTIPVADKTYWMLDLITDPAAIDTSSYWVWQNGDTLIFSFHDSLERVDLENQLEFDSFSQVVENYVGIRNVDPPGTETAYYPLEDIGLSPGPYPFVAPFGFGPVQKDLPEFSEYDWINPLTGTSTMTVTNNLSIPLDYLSIMVKSASNDLTIAQIVIPTILNPGESVSQSMPLPNAVTDTMDNFMFVDIEGTSPGSPTPITLGTEETIDVSMNISEMQIRFARAHIPEQSFDEDSTYTLSEADTVVLAEIKSGDVSYTLYNGTDMINHITFVLPDFVDSDGDSFFFDIQLYPNESYDVNEQDLTGYRLYRPQRDGKFRSYVDVVILDSYDPAYIPELTPDGYIYVDQYQMVRVDYTVSDLTFSQFEGYLDTVVLDIEEQSLALEGLPEGLTTLGLLYTNMDINMTNAIGLPIGVELFIKAYKDGVQAAFLDVPTIQILPGDSANPVLSNFTITGVESIIEVLPDSIQAYGSSYVGGSVNVNENQWLEGQFTIYSPFSMKVDSTYMEPEMTTLDNGFENPLVLVDLNLDIESHMPVAGEALIIASFDSNAFDNPALAEVDTFIHVGLPQADLGSDGFVSESGFLSVTQSLGEDQLEMFAGADENNPLYIKTLVNIFSTQGQFVHCKPTDYITVGASAHAVVRIDLGGEEEGGN
jgi:hypothetical protein